MSETRHVGVAPTETRILARGAEATPHRHDDHQLIYASSGVLEVTVPDGIWFTPCVRAVCVPGGTVHGWRVHGATTVHLIGIPRPLFPFADSAPTLVAVDALARALMIACAENGPAHTPAERRLLRVLVDQIHPVSAASTMIPSLRDERLQKVQAIVESDMTAAPGLAELGPQVGASARTLSRLFRDEVGMAFPVWRTQLRLHRATLLLAAGRTVSQTAGACGWSSPSAFVTTFRRAFGQTPGSLYR